MEKDYLKWHELKSVINDLPIIQYCYEGEVWWVSIGHNVGYEEDGKGPDFTRPVLIVKKFSYRFIFGVPLSTTSKVGRYYYEFQSSPMFKTALLSQARCFDTKRLYKRMGSVSKMDFNEAVFRLKNLF